MAYSAAAMYAGAVFVSLIESLTPGGPAIAIAPGLVSLVLLAPLLVAGPHLPRAALAALGPFGVGLIACAVATGSGIGDGAVLYMWPVLWMAYFFGRRGTALTVACVGVMHGLAVASYPPGASYLDRWIDTMVGVIVVGVVVNALAERNRGLVARLLADARADALTGLLNRRGFDERLQAEVARAGRDGTAVAAVSFDIDRFKQVNDDWGHDTGDQALVRLGAVLRAQARAADVVGRLGGEEFVAVLAHTDAASAHAFAERVRVAVAEIETGDAPRVTVSAGVAVATAPVGARALLAAADRALYAAKREGRNRTVVATGPGTTRPASRGRARARTS
jgi:diguanylate cyclase (GGDEF)-like protein